MSQEMFKVRPVTEYQGARYMAAPVEDEPPEERLEERHHPLTYLVLMLVVLGLSVGLIGCYMRSDYHPDPTDTPTPPDPPDPPPGCDEALRCADGWTLETCDDGEWTSQRCDEYCYENFGIDHEPTGCDLSNSDNLCGCNDVLDGGMDVCDPETLYCSLDDELTFCNGFDLETISCEQWCDERHGVDAYSEGCDASDREDPCQCQTDILDGFAPSCDPEDLYCSDEMTVVVCDGMSMVPVSCYDHCAEEFGADYYPTGCDAEDLENPCGCEYGMIDGGMIECEPGDTVCFEDGSVEICEGGGYSRHDCDELCVELHGEGASSAGCDAGNVEDPCLCLSDSGSGGEE